MTSVQISPEMFQLATIDSEQAEAISRPSLTYGQDSWRRLKKNRTALAGLVVLVVITIAAIIFPAKTAILPHWWPGNLYSFSDQNLSEISQPPNMSHWAGTDDLGRDEFVRLWSGARLSLTIGFVGALVNLLIGVMYGGIAGYFGGAVDDALMRVLEILATIPYMIMVILLMLVFGPGVLSMILALIISGWLGVARIVRGQVFQLKEQEFVLAARVLGADSWRIIVRHLLPNVLGPIIIWVTMEIPGLIFAEAFLSFVGLGVPMPYASWGTLANNGSQLMRVFPWLLIFPAVAIGITMLAFNLFGDGLRDALDPRLRK
ncbi:MAG: ABC transporter permease [Symbiobacteriia bacterium]